MPSVHGFKDAKDYAEQRSLLGALILLPRSRNRSLQDKSYKEKLLVYPTENVLAQSLSTAFYGSNPDVARFLVANPGIIMIDIADLTKDDIAKRAALYTALADKIWASP